MYMDVRLQKDRFAVGMYRQCAVTGDRDFCAGVQSDSAETGMPSFECCRQQAENLKSCQL